MGTGLKVFGGLIFVGFASLSGYLFYNYAHQPIIKEVELVTQSADVVDHTLFLLDKLGNAYLTSENSTLPLTYAINKLDVVGQDNPGELKNIDKLTAEITAIRDSKETMANPLLYRAALLGLKTDLADYAATTKDDDNIVAGGLSAFCSLLGIGVIVVDYRINR
jgi:hypothetical protein